MIELVLIKKSRAEVGYLLVERSEALRTFWRLYNKLLKKFLGAKQVECFACLCSSSVQVPSNKTYFFITHEIYLEDGTTKQ